MSHLVIQSLPWSDYKSRKLRCTAARSILKSRSVLCTPAPGKTNRLPCHIPRPSFATHGIADAGRSYAKPEHVGSLCFKSLKAPKNAIKPRHARTVDWVFNSPKSKLNDWLRSEDRLYWTQGKAGSGKSTFMRFLVEDDRTRQVLKIWADRYHLFAACHFFWHSGTKMQ